MEGQQEGRRGVSKEEDQEWASGSGNWHHHCPLREPDPQSGGLQTPKGRGDGRKGDKATPAGEATTMASSVHLALLDTSYHLFLLKHDPLNKNKGNSEKVILLCLGKNCWRKGKR